MDEFNLHLTGDIHAITAANNLLAAQVRIATRAHLMFLDCGIRIFVNTKSVIQHDLKHLWPFPVSGRCSSIPRVDPVRQSTLGTTCSQEEGQMGFFKNTDW